ncbi:MAG: hypothetical protein ACRED4_06775 [Brevundimonas sp.]
MGAPIQTSDPKIEQTESFDAIIVRAGLIPALISRLISAGRRVAVIEWCDQMGGTRVTHGLHAHQGSLRTHDAFVAQRRLFTTICRMFPSTPMGGQPEPFGRL